MDVEKSRERMQGNRRRADNLCLSRIKDTGKDNHLKEEYELGTFRTFTVVVGGNGELAAKIGDLILFKMDRKLQLNGCPVMGIS